MAGGPAGRATAEGQLYGSTTENGKPCRGATGRAPTRRSTASSPAPPPVRMAGPRAGRNAGMFDDLLEANRRYQEAYRDTGLTGVARRELVVLTCIDSRIDPLAMLGLAPGDAKIIRNAGARVTDDALRSLILATNLLRARRICVVPHTDCAMTGRTEAETRAKVSAARGVDAIGWEFLSTTDQLATLRRDLARIRECELIPPDVELGAFIFDVHTGALEPVAVDD